MSARPLRAVSATLVALAVLGLASAATAETTPDVESARPVAPASNPSSGKRTAFVIAGAVTFTAAYAGPLALAAQYDFRDQGGWFFAPIAGPFIYLATRRGCGDSSDEFSGSVCSFGDTMLAIGVVTSGLAQIGGLLLLGGGLLIDDAPPPQPNAVAVRPFIVPLASGAAAGAAIAF